jgi:cation diffusion facilitator family transporter
VILFSAFRFPREQQEQRRKARRLAWLSIGLLASTAVIMFLTLGQSQAMKTAWAEDLLGMIPPAALLVATRIEERKPNERYPFGYFRAISVAFLATAAVLTTVGLWLLLDAVMKLVKHERPPVGTTEVFGHQVWAGWLMIAGLAYAVGVGLTLGTLKRPLAAKLHDHVLAADADMNKADWMAEGAAIVGILLVGFGFWWGDSAAAAIISLSVIWDGWDNLRQVIGDLMDESPTEVGSLEMEDLPDRLKKAAERLPWVESAAVRLREHGHVLSGEVFVVPRERSAMLEEAECAAAELRGMDWRLHSLVVVPTASIEFAPDGDGKHADGDGKHTA